eukprot:jgi/Mesvir1/19870/Mv13158-RA.1
MLCKAITLEMKKPPVATWGKGKTGPARGERTRKDPPSNGTDEEEEDATSSEDFLDAREQLAPAAARAKGKKSQGRNRKLAENAALLAGVRELIGAELQALARGKRRDARKGKSQREDKGGN